LYVILIVILSLVTLVVGLIVFSTIRNYRQFMKTLEEVDQMRDTYLNTKPDTSEYNYKVYDKHLN
jgi:hypothetical protein